MANRVLTVVAKVRDAASAGLNKIQTSLQRTGSAAKQTSMDFTQFNKVMFATTAYVGFFQKAFSGFGDTLLKGAEFDRIVGQFERVMGPKGELFAAISGFTDNSIDKVEALRAGIAMKSLGIANNTSDIAELIARAGTASKMAGKDSGEGIKHFTQFLKDGSLANLEFLNLIASNNPGLKLQMSLIGKMGGVLGSAMTAQMKYSMGLRLLRTATEGSLKGQRDLYDIVFDIKQSFTLLRHEIGIFLGTALGSLMDRVTKFVDKFSLMLEDIRTNKKEILFLAKAVVTLTSAFSGLLAFTGTIRLAALGLKALGVTAGPIVFILTTLVTLFAGLTHNVNDGLTTVDRFVNKLRVFSAVLQGVYQLVSSFLTSEENMSKGIGKIDEDLFKLLNDNGLFVFVQNVSKIIAVVSKFGIEVFKELYKWAVKLDEMFGGFVSNVFELFGVNKKINVDLSTTGNVIDEPHVKRLSNIWTGANKEAYDWLKKGAAGLLVAIAGFKLLNLGKGFLSNIPLLGKLFKPFGDKPDGTKAKPLHVVMDGLGALGATSAAASTGSATGASTIGTAIRSTIAGFWMNLSLVFDSTVAAGARLASAFEILTGAFRVLGVVYVAAAGIALLSGVVVGLYDNFTSFKNYLYSIITFFESIDFKVIFDSVTNSISKAMDEIFTNVKNMIPSGITTTFDKFKTGLDDIVSAITKFLGSLPGAETAGKALEGAKKIGSGLVEGAKTIAGDLADNVMSFLSPAAETLKEVAKGAINAPANIYGATKEGISALAQAANVASQEVAPVTVSGFLSQAKKDSTAIPNLDYTTPEQRSNYAIEAIDQAQGAEKLRMSAAFKEAQKGTSAGGQEITKDELAYIFGFAIDKSKLTQKVDEGNKDRKDTKKPLTSRRGGC